jgi:hypothetical protein
MGSGQSKDNQELWYTTKQLQNKSKFNTNIHLGP